MIPPTVSAAIKVLCYTLLVELEKPLDGSIPSLPFSAKILPCRVMKREYHAFLGATARFLFEVQERQVQWRWGSDSLVFDNLSWLQGLWASRSTVSFAALLHHLCHESPSFGMGTC